MSTDALSHEATPRKLGFSATTLTVWGLLTVFVFYPLSSGPVFFLVYLTSILGGDWMDPVSDRLQLVYYPLWVLDEHSPLFSSLFEQYMLWWLLLSEKLAGV